MTDDIHTQTVAIDPKTRRVVGQLLGDQPEGGESYKVLGHDGVKFVPASEVILEHVRAI